MSCEDHSSVHCVSVHGVIMLIKDLRDRALESITSSSRFYVFIEADKYVQAREIFISKESSQPLVPYYLWPRTINHAADLTGSSRFLSKRSEKRDRLENRRGNGDVSRV
jgi:hypothetical protein